MVQPGNIYLFDEAQTDVINLSYAHAKKSGRSKTASLNVGHRYTNPIWYQGATSRTVTLKGQFIPPFTAVGVQWTTSAGGDPTITLKKWKRTNTRLTYLDEVETLTSCNIVRYSYTLVPGVPLNQIVYYDLEIRQSIDP